jgi:hypothetical protein
MYLTQVAAVHVKLCHLKVEDVTQLTAFKEKGRTRRKNERERGND